MANWWEAGGATGCVAAYQPIGAASLAASYADLTGNGNDAVAGVAPTFDAAAGWQCDGVSQYVYAPVTVGSNWTVMMRAAPDYTQAGANLAPLGIATSTNQELKFRYDSGSNIWIVYYGGAVFISAINPASAVFTVAGTRAYRDGVELTSALAGTLTGTIGARFGISCRITHLNAAGSYKKQDVAAFALFNNALDAAEVAAVAAAMNALPVAGGAVASIVQAHGLYLGASLGGA